MQQRAFAGTGCADDGDGLAFRDIKINALQHRHIVRPLLEGFNDPLAVEDVIHTRATHNRATHNRVTHNAGPRPD